MTFILKAFYFFGLFLMFSGCMSHQPATTEKPNHVLVDLKQDVDLDNFIGKLRKYELEKERLVSKELHIVLFKFNNEKIKLPKLLKKLQSLEEVENAQSNKIIIDRSNK